MTEQSKPRPASPPPTKACCGEPSSATNEKDPSGETACCAATAGPQPGLRPWPFVADWLETPAGRIPRVKTSLTTGDLLGRWLMRWGLGRDRYQIAPGLYAVGAPGPESPVLVSANYKMSFDFLRRELTGTDAWILALDTRGINVWCAAGKGTFGTAEILRRVQASGLEQVVDHRRLIVPQLGAPGIAAHEVKRGCGFEVLYGPVRAADLPAFLQAGLQATAPMRRVSFGTWERAVLTPVELTGFGLKTLWIALALVALGGLGEDVFSFQAAWSRGGAAVLTALAGLLAGAVITPVLLPWIPVRAFAGKGTVVGLAAALAGLLFFGPDLGLLNGTAFLLALVTVASYTAMNFTGSTTFTSPSGVEKEMRRALPLQLGGLAIAAVCWLAAAF